MNKKRILAFTLAISTIGSASVIAYASQNTVNNTKNIVVTANSKDTNIKTAIGNISDEQAIQMATKAMKDYMGLDANSFGEAHVTRANSAKSDYDSFKDIVSKEDAAVLAENAKKNTPDTIYVQFIPAASLKAAGPAGDFVSINAETGEIISLSAISNLDQNLKTSVNDSKVKEAVLSFINKIGKGVQENTIKVSKTINSGSVRVICTLEDGRDMEMLLNLKDYSVMSYTISDNNLKILPSAAKDYKDNFRALQAD